MSKAADSKSERIVNIERLRFLAAFGIVLFHTLGDRHVFTKTIGYSGLPVFLIVFSFLLIINQKEISFFEFTQKRFQRLIIPWLFWCIVYAAFFLLKQYYQQRVLQWSFHWNTIMMGTSIHLWYLPYAFFMSLVIFWIKKIDVGGYTLHLTWVFTLLLIPSFILFSRWIDNDMLPSPLPQWLFGIPAILIGMILGIIYNMEKVCTRQLVLTGFWGSLLLLFIFLYWKNLHSMLIPYSVAALLSSLALFCRGHEDRLSLKLASLTFGIYLIHPMLGYIINFVTHDKQNLLLSFGIFLIAGALTWIMQKTYLRKVV